MKRRIFLKNTILSAAALSTSSLVAYGSDSLNNARENGLQNLKISLAQWSLHRQFNNGHFDPNDFAAITINTYGINAVEYVNQFYMDSGEDEKFWINMKERADNAGVKSLLIMVDDEGDLGLADDKERNKSVENHFKWVNAAKILGCHSVRVNAFGEDSKEAYRAAIVDSMGHLSDYAAKENINIIIENKWGSTQGECIEAYDRYQGVSEFLPYAKAVSAKSYNFNAKGENTKIDYYKMLRIVKNSGYDGYIGIEYEGEVLSEHEGILATKALIEKVWRSLE